MNHALDSRLERESEWTRKHSTVVYMHEMWKENIENGRIQPSQEEDTYETQRKQFTAANKALKGP